MQNRTFNHCLGLPKYPRYRSQNTLNASEFFRSLHTSRMASPESPIGRRSSTREELKRHYSSSRSDKEKVYLEWQDIHYATLVVDKIKTSVLKTVHVEKKILRGVSGKAESGQVRNHSFC